MESTWENRDLLVLRAAVEIRDQQGAGPGVALREIAEETGLPLEDVVRATYALEDAYIGSVRRTLGGTGGNWRVVEIFPEARRVVGQWPTPESLADRILAALEETAESAPSEEERSRAKKMLDGAGGVGKGVLTGVLVKVLTGGF